MAVQADEIAYGLPLQFIQQPVTDTCVSLCFTVKATARTIRIHKSLYSLKVKTQQLCTCVVPGKQTTVPWRTSC